MSIKRGLAYAGFAAAYLFVATVAVLAGRDNPLPAIKTFALERALGGWAEAGTRSPVEGERYERVPLRR